MWCVGLQLQIGDKTRQKDPGTEIPRDDIGVLPEEPEAGLHRERLFQDRSGIDVAFDLGALPTFIEHETRPFHETATQCTASACCNVMAMAPRWH